jgi:hypothetical protein
MLRSKVRGAVIYLTHQEKGGILLLPDGIDGMTGETIIDVLKAKHPDARILAILSLHKYSTTSEYVDLDIAIQGIARRLSGTVGLGGTDPHALKNWLLQFGTANQNLHQATTLFTECMSITFPPWATYRAPLMAGCLVALDKCPPGV